EMVSAVEADAGRDADRVAMFLDALGIRGTPDQPKPIPHKFLFHLGAALRLLAWEARGFTFHRAAGLPRARQAIRDAFNALGEPDADPTQLCLAALRFSVERLAWNGPRDLGADVVLDELTEDAALDALAEFLWTARHNQPAAGSPQP